MDTINTYSNLLKHPEEFLEWIRLFTGYDARKERSIGELEDIFQSFAKFKKEKIPYSKFSEGMWSYYVQEMQYGNISSETCSEKIRCLTKVIPGILEERYKEIHEMTFWDWKKLYLELMSTLPLSSFYHCKDYYQEDILPMIKPYIEGTEVKIPLDVFHSIIEKVYTYKHKEN